MESCLRPRPLSSSARTHFKVRFAINRWKREPARRKYAHQETRSLPGDAVWFMQKSARRHDGNHFRRNSGESRRTFRTRRFSRRYGGVAPEDARVRKMSLISSNLPFNQTGTLLAGALPRSKDALIISRGVCSEREPARFAFLPESQ